MAKLVAIVKRECPTCVLVAPVLAQLASADGELTVHSQDDPSFPAEVDGVVDDTDLEQSFRLGIETVPTLIRFEGGVETGRAIGWNREEWRGLTGAPDIGADLPENQPGCGSRSVAPGVSERLRVRFGDVRFASRSIPVADFQDATEMCFERGWTDGLPVVPPTPERIVRMLDGTTRRPDEVIGAIPPDLAPCTVEKVAINAVLAGCKPEYMPVVLASLEAALEPNYTLHAILCSTCFTAPMIVVNGPIAKRIGMNAGLNALGQGNRANATIGRAVNLVVRNVGGGRPGEIDRATLGAPSKFTFCFAEDESDESWESLSESRGIERGRSAVTLFQGEGVQGVTDQRSRTPEELTRSLAECLLAVGHPKLFEWAEAVLVLAPEHYAIYKEAGWGREQITRALREASVRPKTDVMAGARGMAEGVDPADARDHIPKFRPDGLHLIRAGGTAGLYSAILAGWPGHKVPGESHPITKEIPE